jgi:hypothetical protein
MTFQLVNLSLEISRTFSRQSWAKALELARAFGWTSPGTQPPPFFDPYELKADWDGTYFTNDDQIVSAEDACSLAAALERSLAKISDSGISHYWSIKPLLEDDLPEWLSPCERATIEESLQAGLLDTMGIQPVNFFADSEKRNLIELIRFCRLGGFAIL